MNRERSVGQQQEVDPPDWQVAGCGAILLAGFIGFGALAFYASNLAEKERLNNQRYKIERGSRENTVNLHFRASYGVYDSTVNLARESVLDGCDVLGSVPMDGKDLLFIVKDSSCVDKIGQ